MDEKLLMEPIQKGIEIVEKGMDSIENFYELWNEAPIKDILPGISKLYKTTKSITDKIFYKKIASYINGICQIDNKYSSKTINQLLRQDKDNKTSHIERIMYIVNRETDMNKMHYFSIITIAYFESIISVELFFKMIDTIEKCTVHELNSFEHLNIEKLEIDVLTKFSLVQYGLIKEKSNDKTKFDLTDYGQIMLSVFLHIVNGTKDLSNKGLNDIKLLSDDIMQQLINKATMLEENMNRKLNDVDIIVTKAGFEWENGYAVIEFKSIKSIELYIDVFYFGFESNTGYYTAERCNRFSSWNFISRKDNEYRIFYNFDKCGLKTINTSKIALFFYYTDNKANKHFIQICRNKTNNEYWAREMLYDEYKALVDRLNISYEKDHNSVFWVL